MVKFLLSVLLLFACIIRQIIRHCLFIELYYIIILLLSLHIVHKKVQHISYCYC